MYTTGIYVGMDVRTLFVAGGEDDGPGFVADDAFGDSGLSEVDGGGAALLQHRLGGDDLDGEGVAARPRLQLVHLRKYRLSHARFRAPALLLLRSCSRRRLHRRERSIIKTLILTLEENKTR